MKKFFFALVLSVFLLALIVAGFFLWAFWSTRSLTDAGDRFFALLREQKLTEAYQLMSQEYQHTTSQDQFEKDLQNFGLEKTTKVSWSTSSFENKRGFLEGSATAPDFSIVHMKIWLTKDQNQWRIDHINPSIPPISQESSQNSSLQPSLPNDTELVQLVNGTMLDLVKAVTSHDFQNFYNSISQLWKSQISLEDFKKLFGQFFDRKIDLLFIPKTAPVFNAKPFIDENGILHLKGMYASGKKIATFELKYLYEYPSWKLVGIDVKAG